MTVKYPSLETPTCDALRQMSAIEVAEHLANAVKRDHRHRTSVNCNEAKTYDLAKWVLAKIQAES